VKLALYHPWVYLRGGIERTLLELMRRSRHEWTLFTHHYDPDATFEGLREHRVVELTPRVSVQRRLGPLLHAAGVFVTARIPDEGFAALLVSSEGFGDLLMSRNRLPAVVYCHTPLKILHDPAAHQRLAESDGKRWLLARLLGPPFDMVDRRLWQRYLHVFANSLETAERLGKARLAGEGRVEVLYPGVELARFRPSDVRKRMLLVPGRIMWQKNIELAIDAVRLAGPERLDLQMVIAGAVDRKSGPYLARLRERAGDLPIQFEANPSDERLATLYGECLAVVFPPTREDMGIVPLEAMAAGAPVVAVDAGGPRESVIHRRTGWLLPPTAPAFAGMITEIARSPQSLEPMRAEARERARLFDWNRFTDRIDDVMELCSAGDLPGPAWEEDLRADLLVQPEHGPA
jgi:glycosyltransferase involved in cell wall biosynthesis